MSYGNSWILQTQCYDCLHWIDDTNICGLKETCITPTMSRDCKSWIVKYQPEQYDDYGDWLESKKEEATADITLNGSREEFLKFVETTIELNSAEAGKDGNK